MSLCQLIFDYYHSGPLGAHMGEYKTLSRIRLRFSWPQLRIDIKSMLQTCAHCQAYNSWHSRRLEVHFSWPVTSPFSIMHCDLWSPCQLSSSSSKNIHLLNCMYDLSTFVISSIASDTTAATLAHIFIEKVLLTFCNCAVIVVDAESSFRGTFEAMCKILKVQFWPLACGNHKGLSVEHYHRFLNKVVTISAEEQGTLHIIRQVYKLAQYAWNSAPMHGTDISRSLIAIGRDLMFPLDIELRPLPSLNESNQSELCEYLRSMSNNVAKILIEERRKSMRDRVNSSKTLPTFKVGDVVKVHVQVQSSAENNKVDGAIKKHQACDLYLLPPNLYPSDPLDTLDQRFLNYDHPPIQNPLHRPLRIESHADHFLFPPTIVQQPLQDQPEHHLDIKAIAPHPPTPPSPPSTPPPSASTPSSSTPTLNPSTSPSFHASSNILQQELSENVGISSKSTWYLLKMLI